MIGYVYIVGNRTARMYKVGIAKDVNARLRQIQTGSPFKLSIISAAECENPRDIEKRAHALLKDFRVQGEWFHCSQEFLSIASRFIKANSISRSYESDKRKAFRENKSC